EFASRCMDELDRRVQAYASQTDVRPEVDRTWKSSVPEIGKVKFGDFFRLQPISSEWGFNLGTPIDRLFIETFLQKHADDVRGRVLEVADNNYTVRFGGERVTRSDVLHVDPNASGAMSIVDLATAEHIKSNLFDCIILTQTLHLIFDLHAAVRTLERILKPGGVLLLTVPGISQVGYREWGDTWHLSMTVASVTRLLTECFPPSAVHVESCGNVFTAVALLQGLSLQDIADFDYQTDDPHYPVTVVARVIKPTVLNSFLENIREPPVSSIMVIAAHPDDELIGAGGHLKGWPQVSIVHVTNGAPRNLQYAKQAGFSDSMTYAANRRQEAEKALAIVGIGDDQII